MTKRIKGIIAAMLILCLFVVPLSPVSAATPRFNNVSNVASTMSINDSGRMSITFKYVGDASITTKAVITTYIEKKFLGLFWQRVDIGTQNDEWVDTINNYYYTGVRYFQLPSSGTYRVTVVYKIYGTGGSADEIEYRATDSY